MVAQRFCFCSVMKIYTPSLPQSRIQTKFSLRTWKNKQLILLYCCINNFMLNRFSFVFFISHLWFTSLMKTWRSTSKIFAPPLTAPIFKPPCSKTCSKFSIYENFHVLLKIKTLKGRSCSLVPNPWTHLRYVQKVYHRYQCLDDSYCSGDHVHRISYLYRYLKCFQK